MMLSSVLPISYVDLPPLRALALQDPWEFLGLVLVLGVGLLLCALNVERLAAERRAERAARELEEVIDDQRTVDAIAAKLVMVADELQSSVERYRQQFGSLAAVFRVRRDGRVVECNDLFASFLGAASARQALALSVSDLFVDPAQWEALAAALVPGVTVGNQELRWRRSDGAPLTVLANLREAGGFIEGIAIDVTERTRAEEAERPQPLTVIVVNLSPAGGETDVATRVEKALEAARRTQRSVERTTRANASR